MFQPKSMLLPVALLLAAIPSVQSAPQPVPVSAADLNQTCASGMTEGVCSAYISGFAKGFYYASIAGQAGAPPCLPAAATDERATKIVTDFLIAHPEMSQLRAPAVIAEALSTAFPCRSRQ